MTRLNRITSLFIIMICFIPAAWLDPFRDEVSKGNGEYNDKKYSDARQSYRSAEKYAPGKSDALKLSFNRGNVDFMSEDYDNALTNYQNSIQSGDREVQKKAFFNMGNTYMKQGKNKEAIQAFINALLDSEPNRLGLDFRDTLHNLTDGHPLFTIELLRDMQERGALSRDKT